MIAKETARQTFDQFIDRQYQQGVMINCFQDPYNLEKFNYFVPYNKDSDDFIYSISGIPKDVLKQFITLNQFRYMIYNFSPDIFLDITVHNDYISIWLGNRLLRHGILRVGNNNGTIDISYTYRNKEINDEFTYDDAYNKILDEIRRDINPDIINSVSFLECYNTPTDIIIQSQLDTIEGKYISHSQFCDSYEKPEKENSFFIMPNVFDKLIKEIFPNNLYKKILQLMNLCEFKFYLKGRDINCPVKVIFPNVSKYRQYNTIFCFEFFEKSVSFHADGAFYYHEMERDIPVYLHDIDDIYSHLLSDLRIEISSIVGSSVETLTSRDIEMYKIMLY